MRGTRSVPPKLSSSASPDEQSELEDYLQLEHIMIMAKHGRNNTRNTVSAAGRPCPADMAAFR